MKFIILEDIESMKKYYPNINDQDFMKYIRLDPTYRGGDNPGTYARWILGLANQNKLDNIGHVRDILSRFEENKNNLVNRDIMRYKSIDELESMLNNESSYKELSHRQEVRQNQKARKNADLIKDAELVFETPNWEVWVPKTYEASCKLGQGSQWCTASTESDYYYNYYKNNYGGEYYINISKKDPKEKYQFHFESGQFMDINDDSIDLGDFFKENPDLASFYEKKIEAMIKEMYEDTVSMEDDYLANALYDSQYRKELSEDFIRDGLFGFEDPWEYWDTNWIDSQMVQEAAETELDKQNLENIKENTGFDLQNMERDDWDTLREEYPSVWEALVQGTQDGNTLGGAEEATKDLQSAIEEALPEFVETYKWDYDKKELVCYNNFEKFKDFIMNEFPFEELMDGPRIGQVIYSTIENNARIYEPQWGWNEFDNDVYNETIYENLPF